ncbi:MAG: hypothetical protein JWL89_191 [Candidatus Saccharibacteria bacterium]|nr:hypothetical protein [Candidatus Saccharibacteria bacterium]
MAKVTLHIPMEQQLYDKLKQRSVCMGFDSPQAYIRFWVAAETGVQVNHGGLSAYSDLSSAKAQALRYVELILALHPGEFPNMEQAVQHLVQQIRFMSLRKGLKAMLDNRGKV